MSLCDLLGMDPPPEIVEEVEEKKKSLTPFDFSTAISYSKEDLFSNDESSEKHYNSYVINRSLSFSADMVLYANEMNRYYHIPSKQQFDFLSLSIRKRKRYDKWIKAEKESDIIILLKEYYNYSNEKAKQVLPLITDEHIEFMKSKLFKGGINNKKKGKNG